ncbi:DUF58 domain-containing protein [Thiolapillus sp.]
MDNPLLRFQRVVRPRADGQSRVSGRKIYILPTRYGMVFGVLLVTLLIASINYANNPAFILTFLLTGLFIQGIFHTWRNLLNLHLQWRHADPVFAGETAFFHFQLGDEKGRAHYAIQLSFAASDSIITDCPANEKVQIRLPCASTRRGLLEPGRITMETRFPLGLLRAWCYVETSAQAVIYPRPLQENPGVASPSWGAAVEGNKGVGTDDFVGHRNYHPGDPLGHIYWKALAGEKGLLVKQFGGDRVNRFWLDFDALENADTEKRLCILSGAVQTLAQDASYYGLRLPDEEIPIATGEAHRHRCLQALALYQVEK